MGGRSAPGPRGAAARRHHRGAGLRAEHPVRDDPRPERRHRVRLARRHGARAEPARHPEPGGPHTLRASGRPAPGRTRVRPAGAARRPRQRAARVARRGRRAGRPPWPQRRLVAAGRVDGRRGAGRPGRRRLPVGRFRRAATGCGRSSSWRERWCAPDDVDVPGDVAAGCRALADRHGGGVLGVDFGVDRAACGRSGARRRGPTCGSAATPSSTRCRRHWSRASRCPRDPRRRHPVGAAAAGGRSTS